MKLLPECEPHREYCMNANCKCACHGDKSLSPRPGAEGREQENECQEWIDYIPNEARANKALREAVSASSAVQPPDSGRAPRCPLCATDQPVTVCVDCTRRFESRMNHSIHMALSHIVVRRDVLDNGGFVDVNELIELLEQHPQGEALDDYSGPEPDINNELAPQYRRSKNRQRSAIPAAEIEALIARWRAHAAYVDTFHATMGAGWKRCADELESLLSAHARTPPQKDRDA